MVAKDIKMGWYICDSSDDKGKYNSKIIMADMASSSSLCDTMGFEIIVKD